MCIVYHNAQQLLSFRLMLHIYIFCLLDLDGWSLMTSFASKQDLREPWKNICLENPLMKIILYINHFFLPLWTPKAVNIVEILLKFNLCYKDKWINLVDMKRCQSWTFFFSFQSMLGTVWCRFNPINKFWKDDVPASRWQNEKWTWQRAKGKTKQIFFVRFHY